MTCMPLSSSLPGTSLNATRCRAEHERLVARCEGVELLSSLDLEATPPFDYAHDHFGYRDRLSQPAIEGSGEEPTPGSGKALKAGEFILGYPDENGPAVQQPQPGILSRNGSFMAYRRLEEHVGAFRDFLKEHGQTPEEQELVAAKLMGRWRSGAPLVLAPDKDDPALGADPMRNNNFNYKQQDPLGYAVPLGSHIRRMNPRDTGENMNRRRMIRRGATYGPPLPEGAPEDGKERGIAAFVICASLVRQFEFAQNVWVNDRNFHELGNERDPIIGHQDGTLEFKIPRASDPQEDHRIAGLHDGQRRRVFFPARSQGAATSGEAPADLKEKRNIRNDQTFAPGALTTRTTCRAHTSRVSAASASTGRGATHGKPIGI